jgi:hypothetical protein
MHYPKTFCFLLSFCLMCCDKQYKKTPLETPKSMASTKPVFGYRFVITGDFDGDGKSEKLVEHYFSALNHQEANKFDELADYDQLVDLVYEKNPYLFLSANTPNLDTLHITDEWQHFGLSYLKNEGDLNGDGTDEVSYVVNWADWSNLNTWHVMTYRNHKWEELHSFSIWDWQLPDLPETFNDYGLFGLANKIIHPANDSINRRLERDLLRFEGLVKKIKIKQIQVVGMNDEAMEDTMLVNLK